MTDTLERREAMPEEWRFWLKDAAKILRSNGTTDHADKLDEMFAALTTSPRIEPIFAATTWSGSATIGDPATPKVDSAFSISRRRHEDRFTTSPRVDEGRAREVLAEEMRKCALPHAAEIDYIARSDGPIPAHWLTAAIIRAMLRFATTPADPRVDEGRAREVLVDGPWFLIAIGGKVGDRFRNTIILDCSPDMKELGPEFHWEDTFETDPPEHLPAGAYVWSGFQLGGWAEDDPIVAKGGTFTPHAALATTPDDPRVDEGRAREVLADVRGYVARKAEDAFDTREDTLLAKIDAVLATTPTDPRVGKMEADLVEAKKALELGLKFIRMFKDNGVEQLCEGVHAGLRKGTDAEDAGALWNAIAQSRTTAWADAVDFAHDPFFSMWGGDEAIAAMAATLNRLSGEG